MKLQYFVIVMLLGMSLQVVRAAKTTQPMPPQQSQNGQAWDNAHKTARHGPVEVNLLDQAQLTLPAAQAFIPKTEAAALLRLWGYQVSGDLAGLILPEQGVWFAELRFVKSGYIKDTDASADWDSHSELNQAPDHSDAASHENPNISPWVELPSYQASQHFLTWSLPVAPSTQTTSNDPLVAYNACVLGRDGYFALKLIAPQSRIADDKQQALALLAGLHYQTGKNYADFNAQTDHLAPFGLLALITYPAKKGGWQAISGILSSWTFILLTLAIVVVAANWLSRRHP